VKPELRVKEAERFQQVYCGLCRTIRRKYGGFYTLFLSYDMAFFALVSGCGEEDIPRPECRRCVAHPFWGRPCAPEDDALTLAAQLSVLLCYHKFRDSIRDERGIKRFVAKLLCFMGRGSYRKAQQEIPDIDREMSEALSDLQRIEDENCDSMDRAADASARLTAAMIPEGTDSRTRVLRHMFYQLGRWLYLLDAAQDVAEDMSNNCYNPIVRRYGLSAPDITEIKQPLGLTLERSLADVCMAFDLLDVRRDRELIRNIIFLGMPVVTRKVLDGTYQTNGGWGKHGSL